jgi:glutamate 5-kinase
MQTEREKEKFAEKGFRRVVIKIGSAVLTSGHGKLDEEIIDGFARAIADLFARGVKCVVVSSGAILAGSGEIQLRSRQRSMPEKQALAAIGQSKLMQIYSAIFARYGRKVAQILLTRADMEDRRRYLNARHTLDYLLDLGVVPIVNENDTTTVDEIKFGDNDILSAIVATKIDADILIMLSVVDGLCCRKAGADRGGRTRQSVGQVIEVVPRVTPDIAAMAQNDRSEGGSGGMQSKIDAARIASCAGLYTVIANGKRPGILEKIFAGDFPGTLFLPEQPTRQWRARERWIAFGKSGKGKRIIVDDGAKRALLQNKSLLPVGVRAVEGSFEHGDVVEVCDAEGVVLAKGLSNYAADEVKRICGRKSADIAHILGYKDYDEVIHRDNLVLLRK